MDPPPPPPYEYDHPHHRRGHPGHHYPDQHHHFPGGSGGGGGAPVRSRYDEYDSYEPLPAQHHHHHLSADHHHDHPRVHHLPSDDDHHHHARFHHQQLPPPPPLPQHRHDAPHYAPDLPAPTEPYSTPPYHDPAPHHHYRSHQRHGDDDFRPVASHHHHHPQQLPWEEAEDERHRYVPAHQVRLSPSGSRKRQRCAIHDGGDLESTSSSGPPPRHLRQTRSNYTPVDSFVDRTTTLPSYSHESFSTQSDSKGNSKMQMPSQTALPGSPHAMVAGHLRRTPQKAAPRRLSVWQRIEENPASPRKLPKGVHISPCKLNNAGSTSKELSSVISVDYKGKSACSNDGDSNTGSKRNAGNKNGKVLASVLVKSSPESKEKEGAVNKVTGKPDRVQKNVAGSTSKNVGSAAFPRAGVKKVRRIVIKKIVRKIGGRDKQISSSIVSEKRDSIDANTTACEKEEGEIITSSFEKDAVSAHNLVSISGTAGAGNGVDVQKEENSNLTSTSKRNAASAIESTENLDPASVSGSEHPGKEENRTNPGANNAASAITSMEVLDTSGSEHPGKEDRSSVDSGVRNAVFVSENDISQKEEGEIPSLSGEMNVAVASNSVRISDGFEYSSMEDSKVPKDASENNATDMDRIAVNHDTTEVSGSKNARREDGEILIDTNEDAVLLVNNCIVGPSTAEVSVCDREGAHRKEGMIPIGSGERIIASLGETVGTPSATEVGASQDAREEEGVMLSHPSERDFVSVSSWGTLNTVEVSVHKNLQEKEGRVPMESSEANTSVTHHSEASNAMELTVNEDTQKTESQMPIESCETNTFEIIRHLESSNTAEGIMSKFVGREVGKSLVGSNERHAGTTDNSVNTPEFDIAGGAEDSHVEDLLNDRGALNETDAPLEVGDTDFFNLPSSRNVESTNMPLLDDDPMEDSTSDIMLNNGVGRNATTQAAELLLLHRAHLSPENGFTLVHSLESSSASGNSEQSVPTALTLGSNIYFSNAGSEGQSDENHELVKGQQGLDVVTVTEFDSFGKRKGVADADFMNTGVQNWLTLPPPINSIAMSGQLLNNNSTVRKDKLGLDQSVDDETFVSQDHDIRQDMDQRGSVDAFFSQDHRIRQCGSDLPQSDLLAPKEISGDVGNHSGIVISGLCSVSSINDLDRHGYQMADIPVENTIKSILPALESAGVMDAERVSSQVYVDPDNTYQSNTEDPVVDSSTKQDLLSSWIEDLVSEAKKEDQPCKSTLPSISLPEKLLAPKGDSRRAVFDSVVNSVVKSPQMNFSSSLVPKVAPKQVSLPSSSREPPRLSQNARHKTWHRGNMASSTSSLHASQPAGLPPKKPPRKNDKTQNSYIRKGNALIRNPATGNHPNSSSLDSSVDTQNKLNKPVIRRSMNFVRKVDSNDLVAHSNISVERPKTPPLLLHVKSISSPTNLSEQLSQTLQKQHGPETGKEDSIRQLNAGVDNPSIKSAQKSEPSDASKVVYVRPKSNQLVAAQRQHPADSINSSTDNVVSLQPPTTSDFYFKKRKNQIILNSSPSDGQNTKDMAPAEGLNADESKGLTIASSKNCITGEKDKPHKALQTTNSMGSFSHVWTLSGQQPQRKGFAGTSHVKAFPRILPWKRKLYYKNFRSIHTSLLNTSSLQIVRKLLQTKKRGMIYTVSTDGFSLRKSAVLSVGGSSLKWSRSLEKRSQKVNKEATLAVADVERKRREKRKRQSLSDEGRNDRYFACVTGNQLRNTNQASSHLRSSSTCDEYVRVSKGNQLVRNPKKVIRMLASEKVRWSLHTVRSRLAKKQQYCQFFTRFGECKKPGGKCRYIHDRAKVAICTKFLKGLCSNTSCKLTHKVLPERMQDCSYFLRGLCTNTACPYRHVKVNSNAPVCEDFLKGYCADGDECHKKHSHVCPVFEATGECPQQSRCKLHHPKKKTKSKRSRPHILQNSSWGRYFDTSIGHDSEARKVSSDEERQELQHVLSDGNLVDFISLDADADEGVAEVDASNDIQLMEFDSGDLSAQADNFDALIKPLRIMRTARV